MDTSNNKVGLAKIHIDFFTTIKNQKSDQPVNTGCISSLFYIEPDRKKKR